MRARRLRQPERLESARGFTLIELLVASSIFVGVVSGAYLCLHAGLESRKEVARRADLAQTARVTLRLIAADLRSACVLDEEFEFVGMQREDLEGFPAAGNVDFATRNWRPQRRGEGNLCEVSWFVDRDPRTGDFALFRRRDPSPDEQPLAGGSREQIAAGLRYFRLEYYDGYSWYDTWGPDIEAGSDRREERIRPGGDSFGFAGNLRGFPEAVRITIAFAEPREEEYGLARFASTSRPRAVDVEAEADAEFDTGFDDGLDEDAIDPSALVFQTVVRLEFAGRVNKPLFESFESGSTGGDTSGASPLDGGASGEPGLDGGAPGGPR